jgi:lysophospholipase L1-like esterase
MNTENRFVVLLSMMVVLALLAACGAPQPTATTVPTSEPPAIATDTPPAPAEADAAITVTFDGDKCVFHGPERVPAGQIPVVLDVKDQTAHESYGVQALTMDEGHTLEELVSYQEQISFPLWAHDHGFIEAAQGTTEQRTIVLFEGPLFLTCFTNTADKSQTEYVGISGPIEIEPVAAFPEGAFAAKDGDWVLAFDDDGTFTFSESGTVAASGTFSIQANELTWETDRYCDRAGKATYTWTFENDTLLFQVKGEDECADRLAVLDNVSYHASPEPTAVPRAQKAATAVAESGDTTWDMVVLGDSLLADDYSVLPEAYAAHIEEDLGVEIEIQNLAVGGETTRSLLTNVQKYPWYRDPLQEAEVILISVGGGDLPRMEKRFFGGDDCGGADNQDCLRQQLEESQANWDALLAEIASLADPRETLIRPIIPGVLEYFARVYKDQPENVEAYNSYVIALYEHMARSCAEQRIPVLDLYALYDGPNADPSLPEIAGTGDGVHVSNEGDAIIAELLRELGYVPINLVTNAEALAGVWHRTTPDSSGAEVYRQYTADGTYRMGRSPEELEAQARVEGEFWFEGDQMVMRDLAALPSYDLCLQAGQVGRYTVERLANGHIRFVEVEDACRDRARMLGTGEMEPVR